MSKASNTRLKIIESVIKKGIEKGEIKKSINPKQVTFFVISSYWGIRYFGKVSNNPKCYYSYLDKLKRYFKSIKKHK